MCNIKLRIANKNDLQLLYCWAIDLDVRANAIETKSISWNQHVSWFNIKLNSKDSKIYIGEINRVPFGQLRFDKIDGIYYIDYSVVSSERGKGLGSKLIQAGIKKKIKYDTNKSVFKAFVKPDNIASIRVFEKCKFSKLGTIKIKNVEILVLQLLV